MSEKDKDRDSERGREIRKEKREEELNLAHLDSRGALKLGDKVQSNVWWRSRRATCETAIQDQVG